MVKKILSSIILIMIIYSTCVYATNVTKPENTGKPSQEQETTNTDNSTTNNESGNQNTDKNTETGKDTNTGTDGSNGENSDSDNNTKPGENTDKNEGTDKNPGTGEDTNTGTDGNNGENSNSNNNTKPSENTNKNEETDKDVGNNSNTNNNNKNETNNNETNNNQTGSNVKPPKENTSQVPTQNNQSTTNNDIVMKSSEARLKELKVDVEGLSPDFDKNTTEYYLIVDLSVEQIEVTTKTVDRKAKVTVLGNKDLKEGENTITINVEAEDGTTKKYYIYVTKIDNIELANAELEVLEIEGVNIYPTFKSNIYSYNLYINENTPNLNITAKPKKENATVQIEGNTNLQEGENLIKITVTAEDENTVKIYKINTYIDSDIVEIEEESKIPAIILIVILGICIIALGVFIVIKNRK